MSLFEMIPDKPMIMPAGAHAARTDAQKMFGLREYVCAYCREKFYRRKGEVEYIRHKKGKKLRFCTWTHACNWEAETPKEVRVKNKKGRKARPAQERVDRLMRMMSENRALLDSEAGQAMSTEDRNRLRSRIRWQACEMRKVLKEMEDEGACGVRGIAGGDDRAAASGA